MVIGLQRDLGQRIKAIRLRLGKSQEAFGAMLNPVAPKSAVSKWETGKNAPNKKRLKKIAELGGVSVDYLINGDKLSAASVQSLFNKAVHNPNGLSEDEWQQIRATQLDVFAAIQETNNRWETAAQNQIKREQEVITKHPLSQLELQTYGFMLSLFNTIRLYGTDKQLTNFGVLITLMNQIVNGTTKYDKDDFLPNIDRLLSSLPVKKKNDKPS